MFILDNFLPARADVKRVFRFSRAALVHRDPLVDGEETPECKRQSSLFKPASGMAPKPLTIFHGPSFIPRQSHVPSTFPLTKAGLSTNLSSEMRARPQKSGGAGNQSGIPTVYHSPRRRQMAASIFSVKVVTQFDPI